MAQILPYIQIGLGILVIITVLLQRSEAGLGTAFGSEMSSGHFTRRGFEKTLFNITIVLGLLFSASAFLSLLISR